MEKEKDEILDSQEVADMLGISRSYLYVYVRNGWLKPIPMKTVLKRPHHKFLRSEVERFLDETNRAQMVSVAVA